MAEDQINEIELDGSVDPHFHFRNPDEDGDGRMEMLANYVSEHEVVVCIGNTVKPILTQEDANVYEAKVYRHLPVACTTRIMVAPLITDKTIPDMVRAMRKQERRNIGFVKAFMAGVSNDGGHSVSDVRAIVPVLHALHDDSVDALPLTCHWHMERKYNKFNDVINMLDREWYAIDHDMRLVLELDPEGSHLIKHATDIRTIGQAREWRRQGCKIYVGLASHYFVRCFEDLFEGANRVGTAFNANDLCWPLYKHADSTKAIIDLATSRDPIDDFAMMDTDCAWWFDNPTKTGGVKITCDGVVCGGAAILPAVSKSIIIEIFVSRGVPDLLNEFLSRRARRLLGLPASERPVVYRRQDWQVPELLTRKHSITGDTLKVRPFMRREICQWQRVGFDMV